MMVFINKRDVEARYRVVGAITRNKTRDYLRCGSTASRAILQRFFFLAITRPIVSISKCSTGDPCVNICTKILINFDKLLSFRPKQTVLRNLISTERSETKDTLYRILTLCTRILRFIIIIRIFTFLIICII